MASVERVKGRLTRLHIALGKSDLTKERVSEYQSSVAIYSAMLIAQVGNAEAAKFTESLSETPKQEA